MRPDPNLGAHLSTEQPRGITKPWRARLPARAHLRAAGAGFVAFARWLATPTQRRERDALELRLRTDGAQRERYEALCEDRFAWSALATSAALAGAAAMIALASSVFSWP
jgi:hypothetical protein